MGLDYLIFFVAALLVGRLVPGSLLKGIGVAILYVLYFVIPDRKMSKTFGKAMFGLEVQTLSGNPCTLRGAVWRNPVCQHRVRPIPLEV